MKLLLVSFLAASFLSGQAAPNFEAATIKPSVDRPGHSGWHSQTASIQLTGHTLQSLIRVAYGVNEHQVIGGPKWMTVDRFDVNARTAGPSNEAEMLKMLQTMLGERFQLKFHKESRVFPGYALVVAKGGMKVQPSENPNGSSSQGSRGKLVVKGLSMRQLAEKLTRQLEMPVSDDTGIDKVFDFTLEWSPEEQKALNPNEPAPGASGPTLFTALQDTLGLRLEAKKVSMDVFVIDSAEKPGEN